jgi:hypothetical protein
MVAPRTAVPTQANTEIGRRLIEARQAERDEPGSGARLLETPTRASRPGHPDVTGGYGRPRERDRRLG